MATDYHFYSLQLNHYRNHKFATYCYVVGFCWWLLSEDTPQCLVIDSRLRAFACFTSHFCYRLLLLGAAVLVWIDGEQPRVAEQRLRDSERLLAAAGIWALVWAYNYVAARFRLPAACYGELDTCARDLGAMMLFLALLLPGFVVWLSLASLAGAQFKSFL